MELIRNSKIIDKKYKEFFIPTILTAMSSSLILMADSIFVGNMLGANELAAVNCCIPIQQVFLTVSELLGLGGSTAISVATGMCNVFLLRTAYNGSDIISHCIRILQCSDMVSTFCHFCAYDGVYHKGRRKARNGFLHYGFSKCD